MPVSQHVLQEESYLILVYIELLGVVPADGVRRNLLVGHFWEEQGDFGGGVSKV